MDSDIWKELQRMGRIFREKLGWHGISQESAKVYKGRKIMTGYFFFIMKSKLTCMKITTWEESGIKLEQSVSCKSPEYGSEFGLQCIQQAKWRFKYIYSSEW